MCLQACQELNRTPHSLLEIVRILTRCQLVYCACNPMNAKYVVIDNCGIEVPIVLPPELEHRCALSIGEPVSAGWCDPDAGWVVFGESASLHLAARPETDALLLRTYFGGSQVRQQASAS